MVSMKAHFWRALLTAVLFVAPSRAEDWPVWRGSRGDGTSLEQEVPTRWSATDNIAWKIEIPGVGHASPIVFGDYVFVATCIEETQKWVLLCLDRKTGKTVWRRVVIRAALEAIHRLNSRASSTPATDGEYVYVSFLEPDGSTVSAEVIRQLSGDLRADNTGNPVSPGKMCIAAYGMNGNREWIV